MPSRPERGLRDGIQVRPAARRQSESSGCISCEVSLEGTGFRFALGLFFGGRVFALSRSDAYVAILRFEGDRSSAAFYPPLQLPFVTRVGNGFESLQIRRDPAVARGGFDLEAGIGRNEQFDRAVAVLDRD